MPKRPSAIVAHFDAEPTLDTTFLTLVEMLCQQCASVVIVSTAPPLRRPVRLPANATVISRPNVGYDFCSYAAGLMRLPTAAARDGVLLANSSFLVTNRASFSRTLSNLTTALSQADIAAVTASDQIHFHLQSYLIGLSNRAIQHSWFGSFFRQIAPQPSKIDYILRYEIGLSQSAQAANLSLSSLFSIDWTSAPSSWTQTRNEGIFNPVHHAADLVAADLGLIKSEVLRNNPHNVNLDQVYHTFEPELWSQAKHFLARTSTTYRQNANGLTTACINDSQLEPVAILQHTPPATRTPRIVVVAHLHYAELLDDIFSTCSHIHESFDYIFTTSSESDAAFILNKAAPHARSVKVALVHNKGRDIRPFLCLLRSGMLDPYTVALKLHGKKSLYSDQGNLWRKQIYWDLCGTSYIARRSIQLLERDDVGLVGPRRFFLSNSSFMGANEARLQQLLADVQLTALAGHGQQLPRLGFFAGSMFWFKPRAFDLIRTLPHDSLQFEEEKGQQDGTLAHAIERSFSLMAARSGLISSSIENGGNDLFLDLDDSRSVPVL